MAELKVNRNEIKIFNDRSNERLVYIKYNNYICCIHDTFDGYCTDDELVNTSLDECINYLTFYSDRFVFNMEKDELVLKNYQCTFTFPMTDLE